MTSVTIIEIPVISDDRGSLAVIEEDRSVPFEARRLFYLFDVPMDGTRGHHAHREQHQFVIAMAGNVSFRAYTGRERVEGTLRSPREGLYIPPMTWLELYDFSPETICAVLASERYDERDYIRDYQEFLTLSNLVVDEE